MVQKKKISDQDNVQNSFVVVEDMKKNSNGIIFFLWQYKLKVNTRNAAYTVFVAHKFTQYIFFLWNLASAMGIFVFFLK